MSKRISTDYPGVFFREVKRIGKRGTDRVYYVVYKKDGKTVEAKAGSQYRDDMTPARANIYRGNLIEGKDQTPVERRELELAAKNAEAGKWTIAKLWDSYRQTYPEKKSIKNDRTKFDLYLRADIGKKEPPELLPLDVDRLRIGLQKKGKHTTAARVLELLRRTLNFGIKRGHIPPMAFKIEIPRLNNQTTEDLSQEQIKRLMEVLNQEEDQTAANVMRLALMTGMRRSEIFKLQWADIDFERDFIKLQDPKGGTNQVIPLNDSAKAIFENINQTEENLFVFPGRDKGTHLTDCRKSFKRIAVSANLPKGFRPLHGLRHVYASMLASSGAVDLYTLQKLLTHKSPLMTQRYAHLRDETLRRASNLAGDIINQAIASEVSNG
jgi:integrase